MSLTGQMVLGKKEIRDLLYDGRGDTKDYSKQHKIYLFICSASRKRHNLECFSLMALEGETTKNIVINCLV